MHWVVSFLLSGSGDSLKGNVETFKNFHSSYNVYVRSKWTLVCTFILRSFIKSDEMVETI